MERSAPTVSLLLRASSTDENLGVAFALVALPRVTIDVYLRRFDRLAEAAALDPQTFKHQYTDYSAQFYEFSPLDDEDAVAVCELIDSVQHDEEWRILSTDERALFDRTLQRQATRMEPRATEADRVSLTMPDALAWVSWHKYTTTEFATVTLTRAQLRSIAASCCQ